MAGSPVCVEDFEQYLKQGVSDVEWRYFSSGADGCQTLRDNTLAFNRYRLRPRCLRDVSQLDMGCTILGHHLEFPVGVSPTANHGYVHPNGEIETARGVASAGSAMILSQWSSKCLEDVAAAVRPDTPLFQQINMLRDKSRMEAVIRRAETAGYRALIATVDQPVCGHRANISLPSHLTFPQIVRPGEDLTAELVRDTFNPSASWADILWLKKIASLPVVVKGILTADDAREAVRHGVAGILVSNHGGRQLDGVQATIDALSEVVQAVQGTNVEVYLDGGIRRGTDVLKALALGARAVFIGRPAIWGLAYDGATGVRKVLEILREEFRTAMALTGCSSVADITPDLISMPPYSKL